MQSAKELAFFDQKQAGQVKNAIALNQAAIQAAQSKLAQLLTIVTLYQDLGGGYQYRNNERARDLGDGHRFEDWF